MSVCHRRVVLVVSSVDQPIPQRYGGTNVVEINQEGHERFHL